MTAKKTKTEIKIPFILDQKYSGNAKQRRVARRLRERNWKRSVKVFSKALGHDLSKPSFFELFLHKERICEGSTDTFKRAGTLFLGRQAGVVEFGGPASDTASIDLGAIDFP